MNNKIYVMAVIPAVFAYLLGLSAIEAKALRYEINSRTHAREATTICRIGFDSRLKHMELAQDSKGKADYWGRIGGYLNPIHLLKSSEPRQDDYIPTLDKLLMVDGQVEGIWSNLEAVSEKLLGNKLPDFKQDNI